MTRQEALSTGGVPLDVSAMFCNNKGRYLWFIFMIAVIKTGGKQYKVQEGDLIRIEKLDGAEEGAPVKFEEVLLLTNPDGSALKVGMPMLINTTVTGTVSRNGRADKVVVRKFKAKSRYFRTRGHRQPFTEVTINSIAG